MTNSLDKIFNSEAYKRIRELEGNYTDGQKLSSEEWKEYRYLKAKIKGGGY